jgi:hypothetical protein
VPVALRTAEKREPGARRRGNGPAARQDASMDEISIDPDPRRTLRWLAGAGAGAEVGEGDGAADADGVDDDDEGDDDDTRGPDAGEGRGRTDEGTSAAGEASPSLATEDVELRLRLRRGTGGFRENGGGGSGRAPDGRMGATSSRGVRLFPGQSRGLMRGAYATETGDVGRRGPDGGTEAADGRGDGADIFWDGTGPGRRPLAAEEQTNANRRTVDGVSAYATQTGR